MANRKTIKTSLDSLPDVLNRTLAIGDYVTSIFADGELSLFKVLGFEHHTVTINHYNSPYVYNHDYIILGRVKGTIAYFDSTRYNAKKINVQKVRKTSKQVAYADPKYVMIHILAN